MAGPERSYPAPDRSDRRDLDRRAQLLRQFGHLLTSTRDDRWYPLWVLLGTAGLRIGEALGLRWEDVDLEARGEVPCRARDSQLRWLDHGSREGVRIRPGCGHRSDSAGARSGGRCR